MHRQLSIVQYLIEKQHVDIDTKGLYGWTPLHYACRKGSIPIVQYLISKGANIESKDYQGHTPLYIASFYHNKEIVDLLISKGANPDTIYSEKLPTFEISCPFMDLFI